ncbi:MAG: hypothetical protein K0Q56_2748 [Sporolactobacillus laevolacticus]|jgi:hypothetical protein|nr:hypothetical protein [Sporolactobacillus laevolacticus]
MLHATRKPSYSVEVRTALCPVFLTSKETSMTRLRGARRLRDQRSSETPRQASNQSDDSALQRHEPNDTWVEIRTGRFLPGFS